LELAVDRGAHERRGRGAVQGLATLRISVSFAKYRNVESSPSQYPFVKLLTRVVMNPPAIGRLKRLETLLTARGDVSQ
jgi:hypothetical protein